MTFHETFAKLHGSYERKALRILLKEFQALGKKIPYELITPENAEGLIRLTLNEAGLEKTLFKIHMTIGKSYGNLEARRYRREQKKFKPLPLFNEAFQIFLLNYYKEFGGESITLLSETYIQAVVNEIRKATVENETVIQMRDRIFKAVNKPNFYKWQALRIARTETTFAMNQAAQISGEVSGVVMEKVWIAAIDGRERESHRNVNGQAVPLDGFFNVGGEKMKFPGDRLNGASAGNLINCYLPGSIVSSNIIAGQKSFYSGEAIEIITREGKSISVTPNHYILTKQGFIKAKNINIGDNLVCNRVNKNRIVRLVNNYIEKKFFRVENVFSALQKLWGSKNRVIGSLDFDEDGHSMNGYVDIVNPEIKLANGIEPTFPKFFYNFRFIHTLFKSILVSRFSPFKLFSSRHNSTTARLMSFLHLAFPFCFRHFRPLKTLALGLGSKINIQRFKTPGDGYSRDAEFLANLIDTHSLIINFDEVIDVRNFSFSGHVYDFTSYSGVNIVNNIYTSNCRCASGNRAKRDANGELVFID